MRIVIVGGGAAGAAAAQSLSRSLAQNPADPHTHPDATIDPSVQITVIDPRPAPVELPPLSKSLFAHPDDPEALTRTPHRLDLPGVELITAAATRIDRADTSPGNTAGTSARITLTDGTVITGDVTILATGLRPRTPDFDALTIGTETDALHARAQIAAQPADTSVGVLGSGFLALELARSAADTGHPSTVYLRGERPLPTLSPDIARTIQRLHEAAGVTFAATTPHPNPADHTLWFAAIGAAPQLPALPPDVALTERGFVVTDAHLQAAPGIYAAGDIAAPAQGAMTTHPALRTEAAAASQGQWLGEHLACLLQTPATSPAKPGGANAPTAWLDMPWQWSFQGPVRIFAVGAAYTDCDPEPLVLGDLEAGKGQLLFFARAGARTPTASAPGALGKPSAPKLTAGTDGAPDAAAPAADTSAAETPARLIRVETLNDPAGHNAARQILAAAQKRPEFAPTRPMLDPNSPNSVDFRTYARRLRSAMSG